MEMQKGVLHLKQISRRKETRKEIEDLTLPETNMSPKRDYFNRKYIFQPSTFRGYVSFWECRYLRLDWNLAPQKSTTSRSH